MGIKAGVETSVDAQSVRGNLIWMGRGKREKCGSFRLPSVHTILLYSRPRISELIPTAAVVEKLSGERASSRQLLPVISLYIATVSSSRKINAKDSLTSYRTQNIWHRFSVKDDMSL